MNVLGVKILEGPIWVSVEIWSLIVVLLIQLVYKLLQSCSLKFHLPYWIHVSASSLAIGVKFLKKSQFWIWSWFVLLLFYESKVAFLVIQVIGTFLNFPFFFCMLLILPSKLLKHLCVFYCSAVVTNALKFFLSLVLCFEFDLIYVIAVWWFDRLASLTFYRPFRNLAWFQFVLFVLRMI